MKAEYLALDSLTFKNPADADDLTTYRVLVGHSAMELMDLHSCRSHLFTYLFQGIQLIAQTPVFTRVLYQCIQEALV